MCEAATTDYRIDMMRWGITPETFEEMECEAGRVRAGERRSRHKLRRETILSLSPHCAYCGKTLSLDCLTIDHVRPSSRGGRNRKPNYVTACDQCNQTKADRTPEEWARDILNGARRRIPNTCKHA